MKFVFRILCLAVLLATFAMMVEDGRAQSVAASKPAPLSEADRATVSRVQNYLNGISTLQARFVQVGGAGDIASGTVFIKRPGRLRFEYDPPSPLLIVSDGLLVNLLDKELEEVSTIPLNYTPLQYLVADEIDLFDAVTVTKVSKEDDLIQLVMLDPESPDEGSLTLTLSDRPLTIRHWQVFDAQGGTTDVNISQTVINIRLDSRLFVFKNPNERYDQDR